MSTWIIQPKNHDILHYGVPHGKGPTGRGSGRYPWGSGDRPHQSETRSKSNTSNVREGNNLQSYDFYRRWDFLNPYYNDDSTLSKKAIKTFNKVSNSEKLSKKHKQKVIGIFDSTIKIYNRQIALSNLKIKVLNKGNDKLKKEAEYEKSQIIFYNRVIDSINNKKKEYLTDKYKPGIDYIWGYYSSGNKAYNIIVTDDFGIIRRQKRK